MVIRPKARLLKHYSALSKTTLGKKEDQVRIVEHGGVVADHASSSAYSLGVAVCVGQHQPRCLEPHPHGASRPNTNEPLSVFNEHPRAHPMRTHPQADSG